VVRIGQNLPLASSIPFFAKLTTTMLLPLPPG
jgi:hypothetical protein